MTTCSAASRAVADANTWRNTFHATPANTQDHIIVRIAKRGGGYIAAEIGLISAAFLGVIETVVTTALALIGLLLSAIIRDMHFSRFFYSIAKDALFATTWAVASCILNLRVRAQLIETDLDARLWAANKYFPTLFIDKFHTDILKNREQRLTIIQDHNWDDLETLTHRTADLSTYIVALRDKQQEMLAMSTQTEEETKDNNNAIVDLNKLDKLNKAAWKIYIDRYPLLPAWKDLPQKKGKKTSIQDEVKSPD